MSELQKYFGKYRGQVVDNADPLGLGRVRVNVPAVLGTGQKGWALPALPYAGPGVGFFAVPPRGAAVWVEFEGGDLDRPIWTGCFWERESDVPVKAPPMARPQVKVLQTEAIRLELDDRGGFTLEVGSPAVKKPLKLVADGGGITLTTSSGSLELTPSEIVFEQAKAKASLGSSGIRLETGQATVELSGTSVQVNGNALVVEAV